MSLSHREGHEKLAVIHRNLETVIRGKSEALEILVAALAANGSVLMEDVPGVGKTTLAKALAKSIDATYNRVQFTPDLLPADILGASIYNPSNGEFRFHPGPVFCNVLLADEINRASQKTICFGGHRRARSRGCIKGFVSRIYERVVVEGRRYTRPSKARITWTYEL